MIQARNGSNWVNLELPQINKNSIKVGWAPTYIEKTAISGFINRRLIGYRLTVSFSYPYLFPADREKIFDLIRAQEESSNIKSLYCEVSVIGAPPKKSSSSSDQHIVNDIYTGHMFLDINEENQRFSYNSILNSYVWTGVEITLTSQEIY